VDFEADSDSCANLFSRSRFLWRRVGLPRGRLSAGRSVAKVFPASFRSSQRAASRLLLGGKFFSVSVSGQFLSLLVFVHTVIRFFRPINSSDKCLSFLGFCFFDGFSVKLTICSMKYL
jgi:hypothetical protein